MSCPRCKGTGVIDTGNNDLPCDCPAGDTAKFNVAGRGTMLGRDMRKTLSKPWSQDEELAQAAREYERGEVWDVDVEAHLEWLEGGKGTQ